MSFPWLKISHFPKYKMFWSVAAGTFVFDQITKLIVMKTIPWEENCPTYFLPGEQGFVPGFEPIEVVPALFYLVNVDNPGAAFSLFSGWQIGLSFFAALALFGIFIFRKNLELDRRPVQISIGLLSGGIAGNLVDRMLHNHVIDFLDVHIPLVNYRWPAFNIADCGIVVGVIFYLFISILPLFGYNHPQAKRFNEEDSLNK